MDCAIKNCKIEIDYWKPLFDKGACMFLTYLHTFMARYCEYIVSISSRQTGQGTNWSCTNKPNFYQNRKNPG